MFYRNRKRWPCNRLRSLISLSDVETPTLSRKSTYRWRWGYQPYAPAVIYVTPGTFLELNFLDAESKKSHSAAGRNK
jgi:hypothetical protein